MAPTTHVVLLRGVNVGGRNRLPMQDLRIALESAGFEGVRTYIQSGNVLLTAVGAASEDVGRRVSDVVQREFALAVPVVVLTIDEFLPLAERDPFVQETDPKRVHAIVLPTALGIADVLELERITAAARAAGSADSTVVAGRIVWLHTPDGFGTSRLASALSSARGPLAAGTARNRATLRALLDLLIPELRGR